MARLDLSTVPGDVALVLTLFSLLVQFVSWKRSLPRIRVTLEAAPIWSDDRWLQGVVVQALNRGPTPVQVVRWVLVGHVVFYPLAHPWSPDRPGRRFGHGPTVGEGKYGSAPLPATLEGYSRLSWRLPLQGRTEYPRVRDFYPDLEARVELELGDGSFKCSRWLKLPDGASKPAGPPGIALDFNDRAAQLSRRRRLEAWWAARRGPRPAPKSQIRQEP